MGKKRRWEDLPPDCLVHVFSRLGLEDLTLSLPFVCKSWHEASMFPECWKHLDFQELAFSSRKGVYFSYFMKLCLARSHGSAELLAFPFIPGFSLGRDLISASVECPRLRLLALPSLRRKDDKQLPELMGRWKELEILEITWKLDSFVEVLEQIRMNCPNFMGLHICGFFDGGDAQAMVRCLPRLKILVMSGSFVRRRDLMVILDGCKELEVLDVSMCRGFNADSEIVQKASRIKRFECGDCKMESNHTSFFP